MKKQKTKYWKYTGLKELDEYLMTEVFNTFSNESKLEKVLEEKRIQKSSKMKILETLDVETLINFLIANKERLRTENNIYPYEIVSLLDSKSQREFVAKLESMELTLSEKKEVLVTLNDDVKQSINNADFPEEYKTTISIPTKYRDNIKEVILDPEKKLEDYRGLDNLLRPIYAEEFTEEQRITFMRLCDICPNLRVISSINEHKGLASTGAEYKEAEEWITSIINSLNPGYSKVQKMAVIDNAIGNKISYSPDFGTEVFDKYDNRALWKIISSGYGVCNGIAKVEQYMFKRIGVDCEIIFSASHAFLKIKNIELPLANGDIVRGNTILDPTWNLAAHRFGGRPDSFFINYEEARKNDIDKDGKDRECHKNDEALQDATLSLDNQNLEKLFTSVGLADKDGVFPIQKLYEMSKLIDEIYASDPKQNIDKQFLLLSKVYPEFVTCQKETMFILKDVFLNNENLSFDKGVISRVFEKTDKEKRPVLFVYIASKELGKKFYFADKSEGQFIELPQEEFVNRFECYEEDLKNSKRN